jgi:hypothetical protein
MKSDSEAFRHYDASLKHYIDEGDPWPICVKPENIMIAVAGGKQSGHAYWMRIGCCPSQPISTQIDLPRNWGALLERAEEDLGPVPVI